MGEMHEDTLWSNAARVARRPGAREWSSQRTRAPSVELRLWSEHSGRDVHDEHLVARHGAGFGFDWPAGQALALRADAAYSHFGKSLFTETVFDCVTSPCPQPPSRLATFSTALDVVIRPSTERLHYIVGVSRNHVVESVISGPRAANALDVGAGLQLGPHAAIEMEIQWLEKAVGPSRWMAPIRIRWR